MRSSLAVPALTLMLLLGVAFAQEDCSSHVSAAVGPIQKQLDKAKNDYAELYKTWQSQSTQLESLQSTISELTSKLEAAAKTTAHKLDLPAIALALMDLTKTNALAAWDETKAIFAELMTGKTTKLEGLVAGTLSCVRGAASSAVAFVTREADEHLPESVKAKLAEAAAASHALWKQHVIDAAWAQPVLAQLHSVNTEVTRVINSTLTSTPALAPLADPVTVQLVVYAVFALPLVLLLVLPLALLGGGKKKSAAEEGKPEPFGKKKKSSKRA